MVTMTKWISLLEKTAQLVYRKIWSYPILALTPTLHTSLKVASLKSMLNFVYCIVAK